MLTDEKLADLRAKARLATQGHWEWCRGQMARDDRGVVLTGDFVAARADCTFIAAANPATVLALLDEIARLRSDYVDIEEELADLQVEHGHCGA